jgi:hypothetical protein
LFASEKYINKFRIILPSFGFEIAIELGEGCYAVVYYKTVSNRSDKPKKNKTSKIKNTNDDDFIEL